MHTNELLQTVMNVTGIPKATIREVLETAAEVVGDVLCEGAETEVTVPGWGKFAARVTATRIMQMNLRDPAETQLVGGRKHAKFLPSKSFSARVAGRGT